MRLAVMLCLLAPAAASAALPEAPRERVAIEQGVPTGRTLRVEEGGSFQSALDEARPGDVIVLSARKTFVGPFRLPRKVGDAWILIRTSAPDGDLPADGRRVGPADAAQMPLLISSSDAVLVAEPGAHHFRFLGIEMGPAAGAFLLNVALIGSDARSLAGQPHHIIFDRCYVHGDPVRGSRRGIALNARHSAVIGSWISDFKEVGADAQAIAVWSGAGPLRIEGNYLEASGENLMVGGADPTLTGLVPSDIEIRRNRFGKPLRWKEGARGADRTRWSVKNLLELKNARRVVIEGNLFERNWAQAQNGFAILFTVRNQDGSAPWSVVEDVLFANNILTMSGSGVNILGRDDAAPSGQARRIAILNNLFTGIDGARWGGSGTLFQLLNGTADLRIENNTAHHTGAMIVAEGAPHRGFIYRWNLTSRNEYGIIGTGTGPEAPTVRAYFPGAVIEKNTRFKGGRPDSSPASDGETTVGADLAAVCAALAPEDRQPAGCDTIASLTHRK
ncbi:MAG TPA: hypothetical protein VFP98_04810 [Candidatus Polarisedimenticolia bacterium]|nr:hypothetical protein [Candidatus Polarisedimenticolia bacterium]